MNKDCECKWCIDAEKRIREGLHELFRQGFKYGIWIGFFIAAAIHIIISFIFKWY